MLKPEYALLMTATPRDRDLQDFARLSGYRIGAENDGAAIARGDAVAAGLLKRGVRTVRFIAKEREGERLLDFAGRSVLQIRCRNASTPTPPHSSSNKASDGLPITGIWTDWPGCTTNGAVPTSRTCCGWNRSRW